MSVKETKKNLEELEVRKLDEDLLDKVSGGGGAEDIWNNAKKEQGKLSEAMKRMMRERVKKKKK